MEKLNNGGQVDLRTIPAIIGGDTSTRHGIVLAKSLPAKAYGIETAEPISDALKKCRSLVIEPPDFHIYNQKSQALMAHLANICPDIEQVSIDECYMNYTPIRTLYPDAITAATSIKDGIYEKFGFTVNIGISDRKVLAKMASDFKKPNLVHTLFHHEIKQKMWPLPVSSLFMCGKSSVETLHNLEIITIGDLAQADPGIIFSHLKSHGRLLWEFANGIDDSVVELTRPEVKGIGNSTTMQKDAETKEQIHTCLLSLAESVSTRLRKAQMVASMVSVEIKYSTFQTVSHQTTLSSPTSSCDTIYQTACHLAEDLWDGSPVRLLGIRTSKLLSEGSPMQMSIFDLQTQSDTLSDVQTKDSAAAPGITLQKQKQLDAALDAIRSRYGSNSIVRGSLLSDSPHKRTSREHSALTDVPKDSRQD